MKTTEDQPATAAARRTRREQSRKRRTRFASPLPSAGRYTPFPPTHKTTHPPTLTNKQRPHADHQYTQNAQRSPPPPPAKKKASAVISLASADYQLISAGGKRSKSGSAKLGSKLLDGVALEGGASLEVEFTPEVSGSPFRPQQAMLMVSPAEGGRGGAAAYAVGKPNRGGAHTATLTAGAVTKQLGAVVRLRVFCVYA